MQTKYNCILDYTHFQINLQVTIAPAQYAGTGELVPRGQMVLVALASGSLLDKDVKIVS